MKINKPKWKKSRKYSDGTSPDVCIGTNQKIFYVESDGIDVFFCLGNLNLNKKDIEWNKKEKIAEGDHPSISVSKDGYIVEVHQNVDFNIETVVYIHYRIGMAWSIFIFKLNYNY
eukprot:TRINITY_DN2687_c0_g1_i2.p1 TRINITY_DN2687_c0_g1~~TRINITY_DN2687_c0_g1_i2.p1  ORF type:complete len:115 (-),score=13.96 TRINITY_DN2687_c0_g1_i2:647-991(-)